MSDVKMLMDEINALKRRIAQLEARTEHPGFAASDVMRLGTAQTATAAKTFPNTGLKIKDTDDSHALTVAPGSNLTADRTLTVTTGDASRTLTLTGNATVNQDTSTAGSPAFAGLTVDTNTLHVDASNDRVGVGTTSPTTKLDVRGGGYFGNSNLSSIPGQVVVQDSAGSGSSLTLTTNGNVGSSVLGILFVDRINATDQGAEGQIGAWIKALRNSTGTRMDLAFATNPEAETAADATEKMRIFGNGNVAIGTTTDNGYKLDVTGKGRVNQSSTTAAVPVLTLTQADDDIAFIDYTGTSAASAAKSLSSWTTGNSIQGFARIRINGTTYWMPFYNAPTS